MKKASRSQMEWNMNFSKNVGVKNAGTTKCVRMTDSLNSLKMEDVEFLIVWKMQDSMKGSGLIKKIVEEWEGGKVKRWHKCLDFERRETDEL